MQKLGFGERYCPKRRFKKCLKEKCAWWTGQANENGDMECGECAIKAIGYIDYTLQTIGRILHIWSGASTKTFKERKRK